MFTHDITKCKMIEGALDENKHVCKYIQWSLLENINEAYSRNWHDGRILDVAVQEVAADDRF